MMWILVGGYSLILWLIFAKLKLFRLSLPIAVVASSSGPMVIMALLFSAQYFHPLSSNVRVFQHVVPIVPQLKQSARVIEVVVKPNIPVKQGEVLFKIDPVPFQNDVDRLSSTVETAQQGVTLTEASVDVAKAAVDRATADYELASKDFERSKDLREKKLESQVNLDKAERAYKDATAALTQATIGLQQSQLSVDQAESMLEESRVSLRDANYDLAQTTVLAPGDGYVTNLQLQKGMLVGGAGGGPVMSYVMDRSDQQRGMVVAAFGQKNFLLIKPGQYAEVALNGYPGQIFTGRVVNTIDMSGAGQLTASGEVPDNLGPAAPTSYGVRIRLDDADQIRLAAGMQGIAAVYTEHVQVAGIPIMFLIRTKSWLKYVF